MEKYVQPANPSSDTGPMDSAPKLDPIFCFIVLFYLAAAAVFKPWLVDFPLNDDWAYSIGVWHWVRDHRLQLCDWVAVTQISQLLWGVLWVKLFGLKLGALKMATWTASFIGCLILNSILKQLRIRMIDRWAAVMTLAVNPFYFELGFSFMTEIPFLSLTLLAYAGYLRAEKNRSDFAAAWGSTAAAAAYLVRQPAILTPLGYSIWLFRRGRLDGKKLALLWLPPALAYSGYQLWFRLIHGPTWASETMLWSATVSFLLSKAAPIMIVKRLMGSFFLLGFWLIPLTLGFPAPLIDSAGMRQDGKGALPRKLIGSILAVSIIFIAASGAMPHLENTLSREGLGTITVGGAYSKAAGPFGSALFWYALTGLALASGLITLAAVIQVLRNGSIVGVKPDQKPTHRTQRDNPPLQSIDPLSRAALWIIGMPCLIEFAVFLLRDRFFDRYVLLVLPAAIIAASAATSAYDATAPARSGRSPYRAVLRDYHRAAPRRSRSKWISVTTVVALAAFSIVGTQDYLAWNGAKWAAGREAMQAGLKPSEIANGFDWDAYWSYEDNMESLKRIMKLREIKDWDWQKLNRYRAVTSFSSEMPGYRRIAAAPYRTWLSRNSPQIYVWTPEPNERAVIGREKQ